MHNWAVSVRVPRSTEEGKQTVSVSTTSAASSTAIGATKVIVYSTVECFIMAGDSPTATVAMGLPIPANTLVPVDGMKISDKIAAICSTGSGTLHILKGK